MVIFHRSGKRNLFAVDKLDLYCGFIYFIRVCHPVALRQYRLYLAKEVSGLGIKMKT